MLWAFTTGLATTSSSFTSSTLVSSSLDSTIPSITSIVIGVKESQVLVNLAPNIWPIVKHPSNFKRPESTN